MNDAQFRTLFSQTLLQFEQQIDEADWLVDCEREAETMQLCFDNGLKWVITPQPSLKQLWFATHQQGYHFDFKNDGWIDNRSGKDFVDLLNALLSEQLKEKVTLYLKEK